jgi:hypothetical protein
MTIPPSVEQFAKQQGEKVTTHILKNPFDSMFSEQEDRYQGVVDGKAYLESRIWLFRKTLPMKEDLAFNQKDHNTGKVAGSCTEPLGDRGYEQ